MPAHRAPRRPSTERPTYATYGALAPDGRMLIHRTTNPTRPMAVMVLFATEDCLKWRPHDVFDRPPYWTEEWTRPAWVPKFTVVVPARKLGPRRRLRRQGALPAEAAV